MGGRLTDWLGQGAAVDRPVAATVAGLTNAQGAVFYFANDTKILSVYDDDAVDWYDIDIVAVSSVSFQTLPDVDWSTPPTDGQVFTWDTATSKLIPGNFPVTFAAEDAQDAIGAAFAAGTHVGISVSYDDTGNFFDFTVDASWVEGLADGRIAATVPGLITTAIGSASIDDLADVDLTTTPPAPGDTLIYDGTDWVPGVASTVGSIDDLSDVDTVTTPPATNDVLVFDGTNWVPDAPSGGGSGGVQSTPILAAAMMPRSTSGAMPGLSESTTNKIMLMTLDFDGTVAEYAQFMIPMPKSWDEGTVTAQFVWFAPGGTGNVIWGIQAVAISDDDVLDAAFGTAQTVTDGVTAVTDVMVSAFTSAMTIGGSPAEGDLVCFQVYRDAANGSDTLNAIDAKLIAIRLNFTTNAGDDS